MILILDRVMKRHPELSRDEILSAWDGRVKTQFRVDGDKPYLVAVGVAHNGRAIEMIAFEDGEDTIIFHALTPPTKKLLKEMSLI